MQGLLGGMIELPSTPWLDDAASVAAAEAETAPATLTWSPVPGAVRHVFTHIDLTVRLVRGRGGAATAGLWMPPARFGELALPTLTTKLLRHGGLRW